jgi:hypothetical protein
MSTRSKVHEEVEPWLSALGERLLVELKTRGIDTDNMTEAEFEQLLKGLLAAKAKKK